MDINYDKIYCHRIYNKHNDYYHSYFNILIKKIILLQTHFVIISKNNILLD